MNVLAILQREIEAVKNWCIRHFYRRFEFTDTGGDGKERLPVRTGTTGLLDNSLLDAELQAIATQTESNYLLAAGTRALTGNWDIGEDRAIQAEYIDARDAEGLALRDDAGSEIVYIKDGGGVDVGDVNHTADNQYDVNFFGNGSVAQSNAFHSKVKIFGGNGQTRHLELYQVDSGDAYVLANFSTLHLNGGSNGQAIAFDIDGTEYARLNTTGLGIGLAPSTKIHVEGIARIQGAEGTAAELQLYADQGDDNADRWRMRVATDGTIRWESFSTGSWVTVFFAASDYLEVFPGSKLYNEDIYTDTTATAANVNVDISGQMRRSTSSRKYKKDIASLPDRWGWPFIRQLRPVAFKSTSEGDDPDAWHVGLVSEELAEVSGQERSPYVLYGADGYPEAVQYDRLVAPLIVTVQQMADEIKDLRQRVTALEGAA